MQSVCAPFVGKKITLMGLGLLGRGVGDAAFLAQCGASVIATDTKTEAELSESIAALKHYPNIAFHVGGHRIDDFTNADMVIKAAGVSLDSAEIAAARKSGVPVYMSSALFAQYASEAGATIVGVTGTRGKTTVSQMIYHSLLSMDRRAAPRESSGREKQIFLGGNVRGTSTLAMLPEVHKGDVCVLELDSWQLQGFGDLTMSPQVAVFTNLMPDHQNYYKNMDEYFADKANIFKFQHGGQTLVVGKTILERVEAARPPAAPQVPLAIPADWRLRVVGEHNRENAALAAAALRALGLSDEEIRKGLESFQPVEGRLQFVREVRGVKIYNDNNATTPEATIAALRALGGGITLICGGSEKGLELKKMVQQIQNGVAHTIVLTHDNYKGSERLKTELRGAGVAFDEAKSLEDALAQALSRTPRVILFSPGFASFGLFRNEYDRNDTFVRLVKDL